MVAFDAIVYSEERLPTPKYHPDTQKASALEIAERWIWNRQGEFKDIMWISGASGVGKSAILRTICETLARAFHPIHASFFFTRGQGARELAASLPPTIAYQFTVTSIVCRWYIWYLLRNDPAILREGFHSQFRKLVIAPASARSYIRNPMIVVIDGLDECSSKEDRVSLLKLIFEAANTKAIRFLIASRPEAEIETFFKDPNTAQHVHHIVLDEETFETSKDIIVFLRSEFARIRREKPYSIPASRGGEEWPGEAIISLLAVYADGQFIYAVLVIGYIDTKYFSPSEQLEALLNPPPDIAPFSKLDQLYLQILTRCPPGEQGSAKFAQYQETVKGILRVMIAWPEQLRISGIAAVLGEEVHAVQTIVRGPLRTLFKFDESNSRRIAFCHKSLPDCLSDPRRSGDFNVPKNALGLIYDRILSRPSPFPTLAFTRGQLIGVIYATAVWKRRRIAKESTFLEQVALINNLRPDAVRYMTANGPTSLLFAFTNDNDITFFNPLVANFLLDPDRVGDFHIPKNALDLLYLRILSQPPPLDASRMFTQDQLVGVLHAVASRPHGRTDLSLDKLAFITKVDLGVVCDIVERGPTMLLFEMDGDHVQFSDPLFKDFLLDHFWTFPPPPLLCS